MRLATTRGTNALLERKGAATALFITRGFADLLRIGTQQRPDLFALEIVRPEPLYREAVEVAERLAADGSVLMPLDAGAPSARPRGACCDEGIEAAAVALLHAYRNPGHEQEVGRAPARGRLPLRLALLGAGAADQAPAAGRRRRWSTPISRRSWSAISPASRRARRRARCT